MKPGELEEGNSSRAFLISSKVNSWNENPDVLKESFCFNCLNTSKINLGESSSPDKEEDAIDAKQLLNIST
ncbi:hypothetical protein BpHYR1_054383 [Brachionus plicatilis]|uniref:Uncharacterized protein n=1 Tax=Brachionus plicatilis TaxID=10195 RepID=A0A3M7QI34_BRAPC|nr:hypothetical protein BpHYR1_054383 [Brachionus plicatilis]